MSLSGNSWDGFWTHFFSLENVIETSVWLLVVTIVIVIVGFKLKQSHNKERGEEK